MKSNGLAPIGDYGLIGDTRTAALVSPEGSIDWLCLPRFDSPPIFGRLVGGDQAGWFAIAPEDPAQLETRRYRGDTATVETVWRLGSSRLTLADSMIAEVTGRMLPASIVVRRLHVDGDPVRVRVDVVPRFGYQRADARRVRRHSNAVVVERGDTALAFTVDRDEPLIPDRACHLVVTPQQPLTMVMSVAYREPAVIVPAEVAGREARRDESGWQEWADSCHVWDRHRDMVVRSLITLRLLTYSPSGAPLAAPTTSLPELVGGDRNWDYRYAWPRDAAIGVGAFIEADRDKEAKEFLGWLLHASRLAQPRLPAMFTLYGKPVPQEEKLEQWPGYRDSRPVRMGNGAGTQHQLDGYGWALDAAWRWAERGHSLDGQTWRAMRAFADQVAKIWRLPDAGIWERRDEPRHNTHSKMMAWLALDRALRIAHKRQYEDRRRLSSWHTARAALVEETRSKGYDTGIGSYTGAYGSDDLDAALLLLPSLGFDPPDSPRVTGTIDAVRRALDAGGPLIYRYRGEDGLEGREGAFLPCSFWLADALARVGRTAEAASLFEEMMGLSGPLGLYAEEMDPYTGEHLGNFPQALTHSALLQAASTLARATG